MIHGRKDRILFLPMALLISVTTLFPLVWALIISFFRYSAYDPSPVFVAFNNFLRVFRDEGLVLSLNLTVLWSLMKSSAEILISFFLAVRLRHSGRASQRVMLLLGIGWFFPAYISVSAWRALIQGYAGHSVLSGIFGTGIDITTQPLAAFLVTLFVAVWLSVPMSTIIIVGMLQRVSSDLDDNMRIDGINDLNAAAVLFGQVRSILVPYAFFQLARSLKEFSVPFLMSGSGPLIPGGFTPDTIVGSTTFMSILLFRKFSVTDNYGILASYSVIVGTLVFGWLVAALFSRLDAPKRHVRLLTLASVVHLLLGIFSGNYLAALVMSFLYLVPLLLLREREHFRPIVGCILLADLLYAVAAFASRGLEGLPAASLLAVPAVLLSMRYSLRIPNISIGSLTKRLLTFLALLPTVVIFSYVLLLSFSPISDVLPRFKGLGLSSFRHVLIRDSLWLNMLNSIWIALLAIGLVALCVFPFAYSHAFRQRRITTVLLLVALFGTSFAGMHTLLPLYMVFDHIRLLNSFIGVALVVATQCIPLSAISLIAFFRGLPREFRELFLLEGSSETSYFFKVALPLSLPIIGGIATYVFVSAWGAFTAPLLFIDSIELMPYSLKIFSYVGEIGSYYSRWNLFAAASIIGIVPLLIFYKRSLRFIYSESLKERGVMYE